MPHFHVRSFWSREAKTKIVAVAHALNKFHKGGVHLPGRISAEASGDCTARTNCLEARPIFVRGRPSKPTLPSVTYSSVRSSSLARPLSERTTPAVRSLATVGCTERRRHAGYGCPICPWSEPSCRRGRSSKSSSEVCVRDSRRYHCCGKMRGNSHALQLRNSNVEEFTEV